MAKKSNQISGTALIAIVILIVIIAVIGSIIRMYTLYYQSKVYSQSPMAAFTGV